jgi:hypothetical protein
MPRGALQQNWRPDGRRCANARLLDHLVGAQQERYWNREAKRGDAVIARN